MRSLAFVLLFMLTTTWALPLPWFRTNNKKHNKDASVSSQINQFQPLVSSLQSAITAVQATPPAGSNNNALSAIFPNGVSLTQIFQIAQQVGNLQQAISSASSNSAKPATSAINITSDLLNLVTLIRSPQSANKSSSTSQQFQNDLSSLISQYVSDPQAQANLLQLIQQIKNGKLSLDSIKFDQNVPIDFYVALHQLITKYTQWAT